MILAAPRFILPLLAALLPPQEPSLADRLASLEQQLEQKREELHIPGLAISIVQDDRVIYAHGFGTADVEHQRLVTPETLFAIGSSTKAFTATLVGMMVDEGRMHWDDPITQYLPYFQLPIRSSDPTAQVLLRDLLSHRTGFARADLLWAGGKADADTILHTMVKAEPFARFREEFHYNNIMFLAAGQATAKVAGKPWDQLLQERIFTPLGMHDTDVSVTVAQKDPRLALGYEWDEDKQIYDHRPMRSVDVMAPAGAINSNVLDMAQWLRFQLGKGKFEGKQLLSEAAHSETWSQQISLGGTDGYGMGWFLHRWHDQPVVEHGGNIDGFGAQVAMLPESHLGYVLLTNVTATPLQAGSMELVWNTLLEDLPGQQPAAGDHGPYLGTYIANFANFKDSKFQVLDQSGKLAVDVPGQTTYALREPDGEGKWYFELTNQISVSFDRDEHGAVTGMKMYQAGLTFEVPREGFVPPAEIDLEQARRYLGRYQDPESDRPLTVVLQNNRLAVDVPGEMTYELHKPDADGKRVFRALSKMAVRFEEGSDGTVTALTFCADGTEISCPRISGGEETATLTLDALHALRHSDARRDALARLGAWRMSGKVRMVHAGVEGSTTRAAAGSDRWISHVDLAPFVTIDQAYDQGAGCVASSLAPYRELSGAMLEHARVGHPAVTFGDWRPFFHDIQVLRADQLDGRKVWLVRLTADQDLSVTAWVDAETGDTLREDGEELLPGGVGQLPETSRFSDFREVEGLRIPFRIESENSETGRSVVQYEKVEAHLDLPDAAFRIERPAGG